MPKLITKKRERQFEELKEQFEEEGRYPGREEEVAARIVNKTRSEMGETKEARRKDARGESPDAALPIKGYEHLTVEKVAARLGELTPAELRQIRDFERTHRKRKTVLRRIEERLEKK